MEDCAAFLRKLKLPPNFSVMARALFTPLSEALVADALDRSNPLGHDGMPSGMYSTFHSFFIPLMMEISHHDFMVGQLPPGWELGLINRIPKASGLVAISKLRPIALKDVKKKLIMNIVSLQIEQIFQQLTDKQQVGCVKGRQMLHHICGVKGGFESLNKGVLVSFDFSNAFPTMGHNFIQAVLHLIHLPPFHIMFILSMLTAPYHFCVGRGVVPEVIFQPQAGIGQGDPFSPLLFSFCALFVLFRFDELISAYPFMDVDDLCVLISSRYTPNLKHILDAMHQFSKVSGLRLNLGKSALVLEGIFFQQEHDYFEGCGLSI